MMSKFCAKLKKSKKRKKDDNSKVDSNSSKPENKEEPENKTSSILSKIEDKKQEKKSFLPSDYVDGKDELNKILKK